MKPWSQCLDFEYLQSTGHHIDVTAVLGAPGLGLAQSFPSYVRCLVPLPTQFTVVLQAVKQRKNS